MGLKKRGQVSGHGLIFDDGNRPRAFKVGDGVSAKMSLKDSAKLKLQNQNFTKGIMKKTAAKKTGYI